MVRIRRSGFTLVELLVVLAIVAVLLSLTLAAVQRVRSTAARAKCAENGRQIGLALHHYHLTTGSLPPGGMGPENQYPFLAWSARLLPYLEQGPAWAETVKDFARQRNFATPAPHANLGRRMPSYLCPAGGPETALLPFEKISVAFTYYIGVAGGEKQNDGVLFFDGVTRFGDITDGTSQTIMVGERPPSADLYLGWWYAGVGQRLDSSADYILLARQWNYSPRAPTCPPGPYVFGPGNADNMCDTFHFWSRHPGGANFLFADGSVHFLRYEAASILPALATRAGGETVSIDD